MDNENRKETIKKLKALRAELMAYKESQDDGSGEGNASIDALRKQYMDESDHENNSEMTEYDSLRNDMYAQYDESESQTQDDLSEEQKVLKRRR